jgi:hypothetical protein
MNILTQVNDTIAGASIAGIPMDIVLHTFIGFAIFKYVYNIKSQLYLALFVTLLFAFIKEFWDLSAVLNSGYFFEPIKDVFFTLCAPTAYLFIKSLNLGFKPLLGQ